MRRLSLALAMLIALSADAYCASAPEQVKIGIGYGLAFLPFYVCEDLKLVEKYAKADHLDIKASYTRFLGSGPVQDAIGSGTIDMGPFGVAPFLAAWAQQKASPQQAVIVSGITTMPLTLLSDRPNVASVSDIGPTDRIAMPSLTAPQMFVLQMQAGKTFSKSNHFDEQVVSMPPGDALSALVNGEGMVTAYFASPPYTELAQRDGKIHPVFNSTDVFGGKASFLLMGSTRAYVDAHPAMPDVIGKAINEASQIIHDNPRRAADIYLTHEPSGALSGTIIETVLREIGGEFGPGIYGVKAYSDFMAQNGELKDPPRSWRYIVAPSMMNWPRS